jgi:hypothetical protein
LVANGNINVFDPIQADGASSGTTHGGDISIESRSGNVTTDLGGRMVVTGRLGSGGSIRLNAVEGDVSVSTNLDAFGTLVTGDGGLIHLSGGDAVSVNDPLSARGGASVSGGTAYGGAIRIDAGCGGVSLNADVEVRGGEGGGLDGGAFVVRSAGNVTIASGVEVLTEAQGTGGIGGDVTMESDGTITVGTNALIKAVGDTVDSDGAGATVEIIGCKVEIRNGAIIDTTGYQGGHVFLSGGAVPGAPPLPAGQLQPLVVDEASQIRATGHSSSQNGFIDLEVKQILKGKCTNNAALCTIDTDCTAGCQTGQCKDANPDRDGVNSQFNVTADLSEQRNVASCLAQCP